jgi:hypothetical protein
MVDPIATSLARRGIRYVSHTTPCDRLPGILGKGGLLSWRERQARGVPEAVTPHYWGAIGKKEALAGYVICSFMTPWGMCHRHDEELAIIVLDAKVCLRPGVVFCPTNSARSAFSAAEILQRTGVEHFDACFQNPDTYQAYDSEIFVPGIVPLVDFRAIIFCDEEAAKHWVARINDAAAKAQPVPALPADSITAYTQGSGLGFRFPGNWRAQRRIRS